MCNIEDRANEGHNVPQPLFSRLRTHIGDFSTDYRVMILVETPPPANLLKLTRNGAMTLQASPEFMHFFNAAPGKSD